MKQLFFLLILGFTTFAFSNLKVVNSNRKLAENEGKEKLYGQTFLKKINEIKAKIKKGKSEEALKELNTMDTKSLSDVENSTRKNLMGVINFAKKQYEQAAIHFEEAIPLSKNDPALESQLNFNLGTAYSLINQFEKAFEVLSNVDVKKIQVLEAKKFHLLYATVSEKLGKNGQNLSAKIKSLSELKKINELKENEIFKDVEFKFQKLTQTEKVRLLEEFDNTKNLAVALLAFKELEIFSTNHDLEKVNDYTTWIEKRYSDNNEVKELLSSQKNIYSNSKAEIYNIGVALPLSGEKKSLTERALTGIELALSEISTEESKFKLEMKDTEGNPNSAVFAIKDLIETNNVSIIIGGLLPSTATKEYLEAKKYGVLYISLSPIYLPKEEKDHLLIEIPASIESQITKLFSNNLLEKLGSRPAILYTKSEQGDAYANEFWRKAKSLHLNIGGLVSFDKNLDEYKEPVKNLLGMKYTKEREEEAKLVNEIANLEKNKNIKRLQNLQPQVDFDWIFVPILPKEVVQVLPNFNYFDAFNLNYIGVPSWRSELMSNEGYRYGNVYFLDENLLNETVFTKSFFEKYNRSAKFVETISYDSIKILKNFFDNPAELTKVETRKDLNDLILSRPKLTGESGVWNLQEGIWIKDMGAFKIKREGVVGF